MPLSDIHIPSEEVELGGAKVVLRALTLKQTSALLRSHISTLAKGWIAFGPMIQSGDPTNMQSGLLCLIAECADLIADIIATAAGEPEATEIVTRLPIDVQFRAAVTIFRLCAGGEDPKAVFQDFHEAMAAAGAGFSTTLN